jgi:Uncharacterized protein conserved in bacteria (DUF2252)
VAKARNKDSLRAFTKVTRIVDGQPRIVGEPPLIVPIGISSPRTRRTSCKAIRSVVEQYCATLSTDRRRLIDRFRYVDAARKVVGVGSVGTPGVDRADGRQ